MIAKQLEAKAIIATTHSGYTAYLLSSFRPKSKVFAFTDDEHLLNTLSLVWGVQTFKCPPFDNTDDGIKKVQQVLKEIEAVHELIPNPAP